MSLGVRLSPVTLIVNCSSSFPEVLPESKKGVVLAESKAAHLVRIYISKVALQIVEEIDLCKATPALRPHPMNQELTGLLFVLNLLNTSKGIRFDWSPEGVLRSRKMMDT